MANNSASKVIREFGGLTKMSRALGVPVTTIYGWQKSERIPDWRWPAIEAARRVRESFATLGGGEDHAGGGD
jgi:hypothetical protein